jgi:hypothetical protein
MNYEEFRKNTRNLLSLIDEKTEFLGFKVTSDREVISGALFDICLDHAKGVVVTLENKLHASSYALIRPLFESFVRAAWIQHCACDSEISYVKKKDKFKLSFEEMLKAVEKERQWEKTLSQVKQSAWKAMNSYTHGGIQLVGRRLNENFIEHNEDEEELIGILQFVCIISFLTLSEMFGMSTGFDKENEFLANLLDDLCKWCFIPGITKQYVSVVEEGHK